MTLTHIDLFAGIGGFALGFQRAGFKTVAHVEIDDKCREVLERRFPGELILQDVRECGQHNLPYADVVTFGSPCQDLSVAGKREGLNGEQSRLFFEAVRIIREIRPQIAVWENVPGALSSNKGQDFRLALEALLESSVPMSRSGRWAKAGMARNGQIELAWRILDAQYFGLAQRRKRLFVVVDFGGERPAELLFERESRAGDIAQGGTKRQVAPALSSSGAGTGRTGNSRTEAYADNKSQEDKLVVAPLTAHHGGESNRWAPVNEADHLIVVDLQQITSKTNRTRVDPGQPSSTLSQNSDLVVAGAVSRKWAKGSGGPAGDEAYNLVIAPTLSTKNEVASSSSQREVWYEQASAMFGAVRRLTPTECARLQGFPDNWNDWLADSVRYRQFGNAVAVPVVEWIGNRIQSIMRQDE